MPKLVYRGNPGYLFPFHPAPLNPGDTVEVPADAVDGVGDDFEKPKAKTEPPSED